MSQALLIDCHKIVSKYGFMKVGWNNGKNYQKIGTTM